MPKIKICWMCNKKLAEYYLLPSDSTHYKWLLTHHQTQMNNIEIKKIDSFIFIYHRVCEFCLNEYLENYPISFKKIREREIGKN